MPKQENTAINHLVGFTGRAPVEPVEPVEPRRPPPRPSATLQPGGAAMAALPRRRAPAATPQQVPLYADYDEDAATTFDPPAWAMHAAPAVQPTPPRLPPMPPMPSPMPPPMLRPEYPLPHQPPAYYQAPYPDHLDTMRVRAMPMEPEASLGAEILEWVAKLWIPFAALGVIAMTLGVYRLVSDKSEAPAITSEPAIVMAAQTAAPEPTAPEPATDEVPKDSLWQPTKAQPTIAPKVETVAAIASERAPNEIETAAPASEPAANEPAANEPAANEPAAEKERATESEPAAEIEPVAAIATEHVPATEPAAESEPVAAIEFEPAPARRPAARASGERSSSRRAAKRAAAKRTADQQRAKQIALAELAPAPAKAPKAPKAAKAEPKVVEIAAAKPMKIGAANAVATKGTGAGKLSVESNPPTLIYVDGRNTGMMTPKTLSLPEGSHKITLLSPKDRIAKTIAVEIEAGKSASLSRTFTK